MAEQKEIALEVVAITTASKTTHAGAAVGFLGWASQVNWIGWTGVFIALVGLGVNFYFQQRRDRREAAESAARLAAIQNQRAE